MIALSRASSTSALTVPRQGALRIRGRRILRRIRISAFDEDQMAVIRTTVIDEVNKAMPAAIHPLVVRLDQQSNDLQELRSSLTKLESSLEESVTKLESSQKQFVTEFESSLKETREELKKSMQLYTVILLAFIAAGGEGILPAIFKSLGK